MGQTRTCANTIHVNHSSLTFGTEGVKGSVHTVRATADTFRAVFGTLLTARRKAIERSNDTAVICKDVLIRCGQDKTMRASDSIGAGLTLSTTIFELYEAQAVCANLARSSASIRGVLS